MQLSSHLSFEPHEWQSTSLHRLKIIRVWRTKLFMLIKSVLHFHNHRLNKTILLCEFCIFHFIGFDSCTHAASKVAVQHGGSVDNNATTLSCLVSKGTMHPLRVSCATCCRSPQEIQIHSVQLAAPVVSELKGVLLTALQRVKVCLFRGLRCT